jgi:hypothetical protein
METKAAKPNDFAHLERQKTSEMVAKRPIPVACDQNSSDPESPIRQAQDALADRIDQLRELWSSSHDLRALRRALIELLRALED